MSLDQLSALCKLSSLPFNISYDNIGNSEVNFQVHITSLIDVFPRHKILVSIRSREISILPMPEEGGGNDEEMAEASDFDNSGGVPDNNQGGGGGGRLGRSGEDAQRQLSTGNERGVSAVR